MFRFLLSNQSSSLVAIPVQSSDLAPFEYNKACFTWISHIEGPLKVGKPLLFGSDGKGAARQTIQADRMNIKKRIKFKEYPDKRGRTYAELVSLFGLGNKFLFSKCGSAIGERRGEKTPDVADDETIGSGLGRRSCESNEEGVFLW